MIDPEDAKYEDRHDEADAIRAETAAGAPELAEHDRYATLERELEEARSKALYAAAEAQNVRRRLEADKQQASTYAVTGFARDMLAVRDHLDRALSHVPEAARADDSQKNTPKPTLASNVAAAATGVFCVGLATTGRLTITTSLIFLSHDRRSPLPGVRPIAK